MSCHAVDVKDGERILARPKSVRAQRVLQLPALGLRALDLARLQIEKDREVARPAWQERDLVFPNPLGGFREGPAVTRNFRARLERNGLRTIRWHALRRVFAALLLDQGVPLERIRDLMGHSALRVTEGYAYTMPDSLRQDMAAIDAALGDELDDVRRPASAEYPGGSPVRNPGSEPRKEAGREGAYHERTRSDHRDRHR